MDAATRIALLYLLMCSSLSHGSDGDFQWARSFGGPGSDNGRAIAVDAYGHLYVGGSFQDNVSFNADLETSTLVATGEKDAFVAKFDQNGNLMWARRFGGDGIASTSSVALDDHGNLYAIGNFSGTADLDPGPGIVEYEADQWGCFVVKLDSAGALIWAHTIDGRYDDLAFSITTDNVGNIYGTGYFSRQSGTASLNTGVDFDPGPESSILRPLRFSENAFVFKWNTDANFIWARSFTSTSRSRGTSIATDNNGNVYTSGHFSSRVDMDPGSGEFLLSGPSNAFVSKLDPDGRFVWARPISGTDKVDDTSIALDQSGNAYVAGRFDSSVDLDPITGEGRLETSGRSDIFLLKLNSEGGFVWAQKIGGESYDEPFSIATTCGGETFVAGKFSGTIEFATDSESVILSPTGNEDALVVKVAANGEVVWAWSAGGTSRDFATALASDKRGNCYATGFFRGIADFDPSAGDTRLTAVGADDVFLLKLSGPHESCVDCGDDPTHSADVNRDYKIELSELLRVIQFYTFGGYQCNVSEQDGYAPGIETNCCLPHDSDYAPQDYRIDVSELLRAIQLFYFGEYHACPGSEDGFCPGPA